MIALLHNLHAKLSTDAFGAAAVDAPRKVPTLPTGIGYVWRTAKLYCAGFRRTALVTFAVCLPIEAVIAAVTYSGIAGHTAAQVGRVILYMLTGVISTPVLVALYADSRLSVSAAVQSVVPLIPGFVRYRLKLTGLVLIGLVCGVFPGVWLLAAHAAADAVSILEPNGQASGQASVLGRARQLTRGGRSEILAAAGIITFITIFAALGGGILLEKTRPGFGQAERGAVRAVASSNRAVEASAVGRPDASPLEATALTAPRSISSSTSPPNDVADVRLAARVVPHTTTNILTVPVKAAGALASQLAGNLYVALTVVAYFAGVRREEEVEAAAQQQGKSGSDSEVMG